MDKGGQGTTESTDGQMKTRRRERERERDSSPTSTTTRAAVESPAVHALRP